MFAKRATLGGMVFCYILFADKGCTEYIGTTKELPANVMLVDGLMWM